ncbi:MAG: hypothetical protein H6660_11165 [Ardenticatenaceae bacterium]|nr:hypothetical protein [Ardenticatenaceae bacterium]
MTKQEQSILTENNYLDASFEQWALILDKIYGKRNEQRSISEMWLRAVSDASKVGEAVRKSDAYEAMLYLTHTFGWVITSSTKLLKLEFDGKPALLGSDSKPHNCLTNIVLSKYPSICPYCGGVPCKCSSMRKTVERESKSERRLRLNKVNLQAKEDGILPETISGLSNMFEDIYGQVHYGSSLESIAFHFLEEIGEVASCITSLEDGKGRHRELVPYNIQLPEEIADVVGWGFAIMSKLSTLAKDADRLVQAFNGSQDKPESLSTSWNSTHILPKYLWREFYSNSEQQYQCHHCKSNPCEC